MTNPEMSLLFRSNHIDEIPKKKKTLESRVRDFFRKFPQTIECENLGITEFDVSCYDLEFVRFFATRYPFIHEEEARFLFTMELYFHDGILCQPDESGFSEFEKFYPVVAYFVRWLRSEDLIHAYFDGYGRQLLEYHRSIEDLIKYSSLRKHSNEQLMNIRSTIQAFIKESNTATTFENGGLLFCHYGPYDTPPPFRSLL